MNCRQSSQSVALRAFILISLVSLAPLRGARRAQYGKGKHILVLLAPPPMRAKQENTPVRL